MERLSDTGFGSAFAGADSLALWSAEDFHEGGWEFVVPDLNCAISDGPAVEGFGNLSDL